MSPHQHKCACLEYWLVVICCLQEFNYVLEFSDQWNWDLRYLLFLYLCFQFCSKPFPQIWILIGVVFTYWMTYPNKVSSKYTCCQWMMCMHKYISVNTGLLGCRKSRNVCLLSNIKFQGSYFCCTLSHLQVFRCNLQK